MRPVCGPHRVPNDGIWRRGVFGSKIGSVELELNPCHPRVIRSAGTELHRAGKNGSVRRRGDGNGWRYRVGGSRDHIFICTDIPWVRSYVALNIIIEQCAQVDSLVISGPEGCYIQPARAHFPICIKAGWRGAGIYKAGGSSLHGGFPAGYAVTCVRTDQSPSGSGVIKVVVRMLGDPVAPVNGLYVIRLINDVIVHRIDL